MGFWSWLGLPEKKDILNLLSEIDSLKKENEEFYRQNSDMQKKLEEANNHSFDTVISEIMTSRKQSEMLLHNINSDIEQLKSLLAENQKGAENISSQMSSKIEECIRMLSLNHETINEHYGSILNTLSAETEHFCGKVDEVKDDITVKFKENSENRTKENLTTLTEIGRYTGEIKNMVSECLQSLECSHSSILANGELIKENENQLTKKIDEKNKVMDLINDTDAKRYDELLKLLKSESDNLCCKLSEINNNAMEKLQETSEVTIREYSTVIKEIKNLFTITESISRNTDNVNEFHETLSSLAESVKYLWTIMKAVWVDSVLSEIDSLK